MNTDENYQFFNPMLLVLLVIADNVLTVFNIVSSHGEIVELNPVVNLIVDSVGWPVFTLLKAFLVLLFYRCLGKVGPSTTIIIGELIVIFTYVFIVIYHALLFFSLS